MKFFQHLIKKYYSFFDTVIPDSSIIVLMVWAIIFSTWFINENKDYIKSNILETQKTVAFSPNTTDNIIEINWVKYQILLQELN